MGDAYGMTVVEAIFIPCNSPRMQTAPCGSKMDETRCGLACALIRRCSKGSFQAIYPQAHIAFPSRGRCRSGLFTNVWITL